MLEQADVARRKLQPVELCSSRLSGSNCGLWGTHAWAVLENYSLWEASVGAVVKDNVPWEASHWIRRAWGRRSGRGKVLGADRSSNLCAPMLLQRGGKRMEMKLSLGGSVFSLLLVLLVFISLKLSLPVTVTGEWAPCPYLNLQVVSVFSSIALLKEGCECHLMGTWWVPRATVPQLFITQQRQCWDTVWLVIAVFQDRIRQQK